MQECMRLGHCVVTRASRSRVRFNLATAMLVLACLLSSTNCVADDAEATAFNIPAMVFPAAMEVFMHQSHWRTLYTLPQALEGLKTKPIRGKYSPAEALALMLKGAPVAFEFRDNGYFFVYGPQDWYPWTLPGLAMDDSDLKRVQASWTTATAVHNN